MLNIYTTVGRIANIKKETTESGANKAIITLAVPRTFKNVNGEYETDFIPCTVLNSIATNTLEYCKQGDLVGIKGRIQSKENQIEIIAEKLTFLSNKKEEE